jgi:hypothetical protein
MLLRAGIASALIMMSSPILAIADTMPPNTVTQMLRNAPNYFYVAGDPSYENLPSVSTNVIPDPSLGVFFEVNFNRPLPCPGENAVFGKRNPIAEYDIDTYALKSVGCVADSADPSAHAQVGHSKTWPSALDTTDRRLFLNSARDVSSGRSDAIKVVSETTLQLISTLELPHGALPHIAGMSWDPATDELLVLTDHSDPYTGALPAPGVTVTDFDAATGTALWTTAVPQCEYGPSPYYSVGAPYRSLTQPAVYLVCEQAPAPTGLALAFRPGETDIVVKLGLGTAFGSRVPCPPPATMCPDGTSTTTLVPGISNDILFDPASDRAFLPAPSGGGTVVNVYDGHSARFVGSTFIGNIVNAGALGLDTSTGRFFAVLPGYGLTIMDGRRTPVTPGARFAQYSGNTDYVTLAVLPSDTRHPYARFLVNFSRVVQSSTVLPYFTVLADTRPVGQDPAASDPDAVTYTGSVPPGASLAPSNYGGSARGYAMHSDLVEGVAGFYNNVTDPLRGPAPPFSSVPNGGTLPTEPGRDDLLAALIDNLSIGPGSADGRASALGDASGTPTTALNQKPVGQTWPFPNAECSTPGTPNATARGINGTTPSDSVAHAAVDCAATKPSPGTARGAAWLSGLQQPSSGLPAVSIGEMGTSSWMLPPTAGNTNVVESHTLSEVNDVRIDFGSGNGLYVGSIVQDAAASAGGRAGTATTSDAVQLANVALTQSGVTHELCTGNCVRGLAPVLDAMNSAFPLRLKVMMPTADATYNHDGHGSPAGYIAAVQASQTDQYADQQFNQMSPEEASFLPALRIVLYGDANYGRSRELLDLAGVEDDAHLGVSLQSPLSPGGPLPNLGSAAAWSGLQPGALGTAGTPGTPDRYISSNGAGSKLAGTNASGGLSGVIGHLPANIERFLNGMRWLVRSPRDVLQMLAMFAVLGAPLVLMARRRLWVISAREVAA